MAIYESIARHPPPIARATGTEGRRLPPLGIKVLNFSIIKRISFKKISQEIVYANVIELINMPNPKDAQSTVSERQSGMRF